MVILNISQSVISGLILVTVLSYCTVGTIISWIKQCVCSEEPGYYKVGRLLKEKMSAIKAHYHLAVTSQSEVDLQAARS